MTWQGLLSGLPSADSCCRPAIFRLALERLEVGSAEALFVGDSPEYDLRGAMAAGIPFVWMNPGAEQLPVQELPDDVLVYLLGSRYCDTDHLSNLAWSLFGRGPSGWARVQAISRSQSTSRE